MEDLGVKWKARERRKGKETSEAKGEINDGLLGGIGGDQRVML